MELESSTRKIVSYSRNLSKPATSNLEFPARSTGEYGGGLEVDEPAIDSEILALDFERKSLKRGILLVVFYKAIPVCFLNADFIFSLDPTPWPRQRIINAVALTAS